MNNIKFSHKHPKLWNQIEADLIYVRTIDKGAANEVLKEYETFWVDNVDSGYYKLPDAKLLQLIFIGNFDIPFCTLRRWTPEKEKYYESKVGETFSIVF